MMAAALLHVMGVEQWWRHGTLRHRCSRMTVLVFPSGEFDPCKDNITGADHDTMNHAATGPVVKDRKGGRKARSEGTSKSHRREDQTGALCNSWAGAPQMRWETRKLEGQEHPRTQTTPATVATAGRGGLGEYHDGVRGGSLNNEKSHPSTSPSPSGVVFGSDPRGPCLVLRSHAILILLF